MIPPDEWSARRRDLYLTTRNTHNTQHSQHTTLTTLTTDTHPSPCRIPNRSPNTPAAAAERRLRPRGHWDWQLSARAYRQRQSMPTRTEVSMSQGVIKEARMTKRNMLHSVIKHKPIAERNICQHVIQPN